MGTESGYYKEIIRKLEILKRRENASFIFTGIQAAFLIAIAAFFFFTLLELVGHFNSFVRTFFFFLILLISIGAVVYLLIIPLFRYLNILSRPDYYLAADRVGKSFPEIKDDLLNAMQLVSHEEAGTYYSDKLIDAAFIEVYNRSKNIRFESIVDFKKGKKLLAYTASAAVLFFSLIFAVPALRAASGRLINFNEEFVPPAKFYFLIEPGNIHITKGEDVSILVRIKGIVPAEVNLALKNNDQTGFKIELLYPDSLGNYKFQKKAVRNSFKYFAQAENIKSDEFSVEVIDRPIVKTFEITVTPPAYSKLPQVIQKENGNITALTGSIVNVNLSSTKKLRKAELVFSDTLAQRSAEKSGLALSNESEKANGKFRIKGDSEYKMVLTDQSGNQNLSPILYSIKALPDLYPSIDVISPNRNISLANDNRVPLYLKVADDYGFSKLLLHYRLSSSKYEAPEKDFKSLEISFDKKLKETDVSYVWNLSQLNLAVEDIISYYLEIFDNDNVSGPKSAKSSVFTVRVPSLDEILAKAGDTQSQAEQDLTNTLKEAEELKRNLENIDQDLKKDKRELTWEEKEKIQRSLDKFEELQQKTDDVSKELQKMQQDLQQNNLLSKETLEKYMELQDLMQQLTGEEMKKAMEQMQKMLQSLNRQQTQDQLQNFKMDEERFQKSIERTINLLKRIQIEQKVDELVKRTENLTDNQKDLQEQTSKNLNNNENKELAEKQKEATNEFEKLNDEMKKLSEKMEDLKDMPKEDLDKIIEKSEKMENSELSKEATQNIMQNQMMPAMQKQQKLSQNSMEMNRDLEQLQESIRRNNQLQTFTDMMKIMDNILTLSNQEEDLKKESQNLDYNSSSFNENAEKQSGIQKNLDNILKQMSDLSQKTFAITPEMGKSLGDAKREMMKSIQALQNRSGEMAGQSQTQAMESLNEAATLMKGSMDAMMQGSGQGGMMSLMQQLQMLSQQQMNLNNLTQMLQQGQQGQLSPQQQAQLERLAQQQDLIRKSIQQLNKEARESGISKKIPSNLEQIMNEMREVVSDLNTEKLDDNLIQKQERILSRMLDAQRSINERDFENKRESKTGENVARESPEELNLSSDKGKDKLRDELNRIIREGYLRDYEVLIRKYFEALQKENIKN
ncbi:MAG TPA: DUF4175 family protein [Ignavibacteriaceae bacterium]|nr:DUF4175 family protein [Ignavibacteriaceae bacterium]